MKGLTRITERGPVLCDYCGLSVQEANQRMRSGMGGFASFCTHLPPTALPT